MKGTPNAYGLEGAARQDRRVDAGGRFFEGALTTKAGLLSAKR
jgi:hypothetical protein